MNRDCITGFDVSIVEVLKDECYYGRELSGEKTVTTGEL